MPTQRPLTVLHAAGGFGKTTVLAECCRRLRAAGVATAWLSLDEQDAPPVLDAYIAFACAEAGLNLLDVPNPETAPVGPEGRIGLVLREIQSFGGPFVIALDELERLEDPASVSLLAFLLLRAPPNLHLAVACRVVPDGFDVAGALLEGRAEELSTEELRFSHADVARFFDLRLSRRALAEEMRRSAGWAFALRISRNSMERGKAIGIGNARALIDNWIESRLFAGLERDDRDFVLDLGLFRWIDATLLGEVLQDNSMRRMESLTALAGLIEPVGDDVIGKWRLHPLLREHCAKQRWRENPKRFGAIHRRIAKAVAKRGETVLAMRHAVEGGDPFLAGEILEQAGGVGLWIRQGVVRLKEANRLLTEEVISEKPRLKLLRCSALILEGRQREARTLYRECPRPARVDGDDADFEYFADNCWVRSALALYGGSPDGSDWVRSYPGNMARLARSPRLDPRARGHFEYGLCVLHFLKGEFDIAVERLSLARELLAGTQYVALYGELLHGQIDFVAGRAEDALSRVRRARRIARQRFLLDPVAVRSCEVVMSEIALERNVESTSLELPGVQQALMSQGIPFSLFATASNVLIGARLQGGRVDQALTAVDALLAHSRRSGSTMFARLLVALQTSVLVVARRVSDAERAWRREGLPEDVAGCVDLSAQSWREMEAISEARARLLIAGERLDEARALLGELRTVSVERGLRRIEMRALALRIMLEQHAGDTQASVRRLTEYLRLFAESPYAWPLLRERATCAELLRKYLDADSDQFGQEEARSLLASMRRMDAGPMPSFSDREREVLRRLPGHRDKEVAAALGLSVHGVRYHLRKLFKKLGTGNRADALRRAKELGLISCDS